MQVTRLGINGLGRIGRRALLLARNFPRLEVAAVNDPGMDTGFAAHMLRFDSAHGASGAEVEEIDQALVVEGNVIAYSQHRDPQDVDWSKHGVDVVLECSGFFRKRDAAAKHLAAGARKVLISAPAGDADGMFVYGVNHLQYDGAAHDVISGASCTTNCLAPLVAVLRQFDFQSGWMDTVHAYTSDQRLHDAPHTDRRRARAAAASIVPSETGAAKAIGKIFPDLDGRIDGAALRVPVITGSCVTLTAELGKEATRDELLAAFRTAAERELKDVLEVCDDELVSTDFIGASAGSIVDAGELRMVGSQKVRVLSWYDNEDSFTNQFLRLASHVGETL